MKFYAKSYVFLDERLSTTKSTFFPPAFKLAPSFGFGVYCQLQSGGLLALASVAFFSYFWVKNRLQL